MRVILAVSIAAGLSVAAPTVAQSVDEIAIAMEIVDRMPVNADSVFAGDVGRVWCWMRVSGAPEAGTTLHHVWIRGEEELADVALTIGGSSWRTWSSKTIPGEWAGEWRVEVRDESGNVLETIRFRVGDP